MAATDSLSAMAGDSVSVMARGAIAAPPSLASPGDYIALMKPRVMRLVVFTGFIGMLLAPSFPATHPLLLAISLVAIAAGAGAAGAINQWYERDIDAVMPRTVSRPLPQGRIAPDEALALGLAVSLFSVAVLYFAGGAAAAGLLAFTIFFYGVIYTIWLKRRTAQNIVIGGAAGAFPPVIGWLAAGGDATAAMPLLLFAIIFIWTPPHFWALALARRDEYKRAAIPMLPVVAGERSTLRQITLYSVLLAPLGVMPWALGLTGVFYGAVAIVLGGGFLLYTARLMRARDNAAAMGLFRFSILYLFLIFLALGVDVLLLRGGVL